MKKFKLIKSLTCSLALVFGLATGIKAETPETIPQELETAIREIETAANQRDLAELMEYYSPEFTNNDGLTKESLGAALKQIWDNYPRLKYITTIESWEQAGDELVVKTQTQIRGTQPTKGRVINLDSVVDSQQYFRDGKLVRQEILSEQTQITSGANPPQVEIVAPETVKVGEEYNFEVIVTEPIGNEVLLGAATEEVISGDRYLNPTTLELEQLSAGGIFKTAQASLLPEDKWLSAILVRGDGITMITQRVRTQE
ncbi:MAG TPA: nuclear transport factor 2 family protein [Xenococcaceae cyanobacterium]